MYRKLKLFLCKVFILNKAVLRWGQGGRSQAYFGRVGIGSPPPRARGCLGEAGALTPPGQGMPIILNMGTASITTLRILDLISHHQTLNNPLHLFCKRRLDISMNVHKRQSPSRSCHVFCSPLVCHLSLRIGYRLYRRPLQYSMI